VLKWSQSGPGLRPPALPTAIRTVLDSSAVSTRSFAGEIGPDNSISRISRTESDAG
jgi:hypothetical protein